jgi:hypothetical protein
LPLVCRSISPPAGAASRTFPHTDIAHPAPQKFRLDQSGAGGMTRTASRHTPESIMFLARLLAAAAIAAALCGCQALKDDPIMGDHPWQPGMPLERSASTNVPRS